MRQLQSENRICGLLNGHTHRRHLGYFGRILNLNAGKLSASHDGLAGGVWLVDFAEKRATLRLFESAARLVSPFHLRFEERFWESR